MKTCEQRVAGNLEDRLGQLKEGELEPLSIDRNVDWDDGEPSYTRIQLSWGGPSDEFRFYKSGKAEYWFLDWNDGACVELTAQQKEVIMDTWPV